MANARQGSKEAMSHDDMLIELDAALIDVEYHLSQAFENLDEARYYATKLTK